MAKVQLRIKGIEALKKKLMEQREIMINYLTYAMAELGERAVTYSKDNKGYQDHTANLKNTIDYALFLDGELVCVGDHEELNGTEKIRLILSLMQQLSMLNSKVLLPPKDILLSLHLV